MGKNKIDNDLTLDDVNLCWSVLSDFAGNANPSQLATVAAQQAFLKLDKHLTSRPGGLLPDQWSHGMVPPEFPA